MNFNKALSENPHTCNAIFFSYISYIVLNLIKSFKIYYTFLPIQFHICKVL